MTFNEARDAVLITFKAYWDANAGAVNGAVVPPVDYSNVKDLAFPSPSAAWARVSVLPIGEAIRSLGGVGGRVYYTEGVCTVQIYVPLGIAGLKLAYDLREVAVSAFRGQAAGTDDELVFRDIMTIEAGEHIPSWYEMRVKAFFDFPSLA